MLLDANSPSNFILFILIFFSAILIRYFIAAGIFYFYYYILKSSTYESRIISHTKATKDQLKKEIIWSIKSSAVFAVVGALTFWMWQNGLTAIYMDISHYSYWYLPVSLVIVMLIHETYYYWVHRWMHQAKVFPIVHKVHHDSLSPTPWTAFSFHPWECLLEAIILPLIFIVIPMHPFVIGFYLLIMTISSVINHLDIEIYPLFFQRSKIGKLFIGASHHHLHHKEFKTNYGLYFTFWDKLMDTENPKMQNPEKKIIASEKRTSKT